MNAVLMPPLSDSESRYEVVKGQRVEKPTMGVHASAMASFLTGLLNAFAAEKLLGVASSEMLFKLGAEGNQRRPEVAYIVWERWCQLPSVDADDPAYADFAPNLAIEVVSPSNTAAEMERRVLEYFKAGVDLVWIVFPGQGRLHAYDSPTSVRIFNENDEIDAEPLVPGFRFRLIEILKKLRTK